MSTLRSLGDDALGCGSSTSGSSISTRESEKRWHEIENIENCFWTNLIVGWMPQGFEHALQRPLVRQTQWHHPATPMMGQLAASEEAVRHHQTTINLAGTECELVVDGRVDGPAAHELEIEVLALAKTDATTVYVNLAGANFLCSAAIRVLLQHRRQWKAKG